MVFQTSVQFRDVCAGLSIAGKDHPIVLDIQILNLSQTSSDFVILIMLKLSNVFNGMHFTIKNRVPVGCAAGGTLHLPRDNS